MAVLLWRLFFCFHFFVVSLSLHCKECPVAHTEYGDVIGTHWKTFRGRTINAFLSIPYAEKPLGNARFEEARPPKPWSEPLACRIQPEPCVQVLRRGGLAGKEDCLYLNVFVPGDAKNTSRPLPVVVFIHGGAFHFMSSNTNGPRYMLDRDLILVSFNYRIGILGFLCTESPLVPGNNGLKDQAHALGWVHRNIAFFGGDPSSVTIMGMSAGAASVQFHYFSVLSRGLFQRGYMLGGSAFNSFSIQKNPLQKAQAAARSLGCPVIPEQSMVSCLKQKPATQLAETVKIFWGLLNMPLSPWGPVVDRWSRSPFIREYPLQAMLAGRHFNVPLLASDVPNGGLFPIAQFIEDEATMLDLDSRWNELAPYMLDTVDSVPAKEQNNTMQFIRFFYFGKKPIYKDRTALIRASSDRLYLGDIARSVAMHASVNPRVYFYMFHYRGAKSSSQVAGSTTNYGASHIDDLYYLMNNTENEPGEKNETDVRMIDRMLDMLYTYITTGTPVFLKSVSWRPVEASPKVRYLSVNSPDSAVMESSAELGSPRFWAALPIHEPWAGRILYT